MRRAMICITVMLGLLQGWLLVFGGKQTPVEVAVSAARSTVSAAANGSSQLVPAIANASSKPKQLISQASKSTGQLSCYRHYEIAFANCSPRDRACRMRAADQWDLCEATGLWGN